MTHSDDPAAKRKFSPYGYGRGTAVRKGLSNPIFAQAIDVAAKRSSSTEMPRSPSRWPGRGIYAFAAARISLRVLGLLAVLMAVTLVIAGLVIYGAGMWPHLIAESAGVEAYSALIL